MRAVVVAALVATLAPLAGAVVGGGTVAAATPCPCSLFAPTAVPANVEFLDTRAVELGVQFQSSIAGVVTGIRFYKGPDNTGQHVGSLWTADGTLLAQATFGAETASGWQQVNFSTPVTILPNTTYVAGYHTNTGFYAYDAGYFTTTTLTNGPLSAPSDASGTPNGVFAYSPTPVFPTGTYNGNNYWVDVVMAGAPSGLAITVPQPAPPKGTSEQLQAIESFSDGTTNDVTSQVAWGDTNGGATISPSGRLTAAAVGPTTVTASLNGLSAAAPLTVAPPALTTIAVGAPSATLPGGASEQLTATGTYTDASTANLAGQVTWSSSSPGSVAVSATGAATATGRGQATITAAASGVSGAVVLSGLAPAAFVSVTPPVVALQAGRSQQLSATAYLVDGTAATVTPIVQWATSPVSGVTVSASGLVSAPSRPAFALVTAALGRTVGFAAVFVYPSFPNF